MKKDYKIIIRSRELNCKQMFSEIDRTISYNIRQYWYCDDKNNFSEVSISYTYNGNDLLSGTLVADVTMTLLYSFIKIMGEKVEAFEKFFDGSNEISRPITNEVMESFIDRMRTKYTETDHEVVGLIDYYWK